MPNPPIRELRPTQPHGLCLVARHLLFVGHHKGCAKGPDGCVCWLLLWLQEILRLALLGGCLGRRGLRLSNVSNRHGRIRLLPRLQQ